MRFSRLILYGQQLRTDMVLQAQNDYEWFDRIRHTLEKYIGDVRGRDILDVGCGQRYPLTLLFHSFGSRVVGIDTALIGVDLPVLETYRRICAEEGLGRALKTFVRRFMQDGTYYEALRTSCPFPLTFEGVDVRQMSVTEMSFPDATFDAVVSVAVFEHVADVPRAVSEIRRVLKSGSIAHISIHLYTSLSGGHHIEYGYFEYSTLGRRHVPISRRVPPWDHLRNNLYPVPVYLNKLRECEYISAFAQELEIVEVIDGCRREGENLLTPEIRAELSCYSEEELLKRGITIVARKSSG